MFDFFLQGSIMYLLSPPGRFFKENKMGIKEYLQETKGEFKHVSWPTKAQAISFTVFVIVISVATSLYLGFFDYIFSAIWQGFLRG